MRILVGYWENCLIVYSTFWIFCVWISLIFYFRPDYVIVQLGVIWLRNTLFWDWLVDVLLLKIVWLVGLKWNIHNII